jgi:GGDEF domain-containing protein
MADAGLILGAVHRDDREAFNESIAVSVRTLEAWAWEGRIVRADGATRWLQGVSRPERHADGSTVWDGLLLDATRARRAEETITWQARHDALTGLPNRTVYLERLEDALGRVRRDGELVGVCFVDLDRFKEINDTQGHAVGDQVLRAAARRVAAYLRPEDTVARLGGDDLTVLLTHLPGAAFAAHLAQGIVDAFAEPLVIGAARSR